MDTVIGRALPAFTADVSFYPLLGPRLGQLCCCADQTRDTQTPAGLQNFQKRLFYSVVGG